MRSKVCSVVLFLLFASAALMASEKSGSGRKVEVTGCGTVRGEAVKCYLLRNQNGVEAKLTDFGATMISLKVPDRTGKFEDVVLGYDTVQEYEDGKSYFGGTIGRYGNRIGNARFVLDGKTYTLAKNDGQNSLHGGTRGFNKVLWRGTDVSRGDEAAVQFRYVSKDGEEGYPGTLTATVTITLTRENEVRIDYDATTDKDTVQNLTNHTYFNLTAGRSDILSHELSLEASRFTPVDETLIPTGELRSVEGTPFDFRVAKTIGERINQPDEQLKRGKGYDHNWVLNGEMGKLHLAAKVYEPTSGRVLEVTTTEPGVQFYSGNFLHGEKGKGGKSYAFRTAFTLETQHYPDSPNRPNFPTTELKAGQRYQSTTVYRFSVK